MSEPTEVLLRLLLQRALDHALILLDDQGQIVAWLAGAEHIFGYRPQEMIGQPLATLFTPEDRQRGLDAHELAVARQDGRAEDDRWQLRKDGSRFWASGVVVPLRDADGRLVGFGKILRDRTDIKTQIEALEKRSAALAQADRRKNLFLGTLAHELRNPLGPLLNALHLLRPAMRTSPDLTWPVQIIERQVEALRRLVDDLLDVTRIGAGKIDLSKKSILLGDLLTRVAEAWRPRAEQRKQCLRVLLPTGPIPVEADPSRLEQVFVNLVSNAVKYTPPDGSIWLKATTEGNDAVVTVQDTGVGIAPDVLPRLFELFTQEESSRPRSEGGLGIGLALVKDLVTLHGGTVQARSEGKNKGSEFTVRLPLGPGDQPANG